VNSGRISTEPLLRGSVIILPQYSVPLLGSVIILRGSVTNYEVSRYPAAGKCFQKTWYPAVRNVDQFSRNSSFNSSMNIRYLFRNLKRLYIWANLCWRHCLHFCSLAYDLPNRSRGRIYELNNKSWKSWLSWAICAIFRSLQAVLKEISAIKNCEIAGWQKS